MNIIFQPIIVFCLPTNALLSLISKLTAMNAFFLNETRMKKTKLFLIRTWFTIIDKNEVINPNFVVSVMVALGCEWPELFFTVLAIDALLFGTSTQGISGPV